MIDPTLSENWGTDFKWNEAGPEAHDSASITRWFMTTAATRDASDVERANDIDSIAFGSWVQAKRRARGLSRPELARLAGVHPFIIFLLERGLLFRRELTPELVCQIAHGFGQAVDELDVLPFDMSAAETQKQSAIEGFGRWLSDTLKGVTARPPQLAYLRLAGSGSSSAVSVDDDILQSPVWLGEYAVELPDGSEGLARLTLEPSPKPEPGAANIQVRLVRRDEALDHPVEGVIVALDTDPIPYRFNAPTNAMGRTVIKGVSLQILTELSQLPLSTRLPQPDDVYLGNV